MIYMDSECDLNIHDSPGAWPSKTAPLDSLPIYICGAATPPPPACSPGAICHPASGVLAACRKLAVQFPAGPLSEQPSPSSSKESQAKKLDR